MQVNRLLFMQAARLVGRCLRQRGEAFSYIGRACWKCGLRLSPGCREEALSTATWRFELALGRPCGQGASASPVCRMLEGTWGIGATLKRAAGTRTGTIRTLSIKPKA